MESCLSGMTSETVSKQDGEKIIPERCNGMNGNSILKQDGTFKGTVNRTEDLRDTSGVCKVFHRRGLNSEDKFKSQVKVQA